jgi:hypothetical protein
MAGESRVINLPGLYELADDIERVSNRDRYVIPCDYFGCDRCLDCRAYDSTNCVHTAIDDVLRRLRECGIRPDGRDS